MHRSATHSIVLLALLVALGRPAVGEVFVLRTGGRVVGDLLNPDERLRQKYVIRAPNGTQLTLNRSQVKEVLHVRPDQRQYEKTRATFPDTVEGQWALAQWCLTRRLPEQRKTHLNRIIELEPDHEDARRALGYGKIDGRWATQEQVMIRRGFKRYGNRWLTSQEIELLEKKRNAEVAEKDWALKLNRWRKWLETERELDGRRNILDMRDPPAAKALIRGLVNDSVDQVRILYIEALANIGTPAAVEALAVCSLDDPVEEVRLTCLDYLHKETLPDVVDYYVGKLRSKDNRLVNRAALGLGYMKDPSAVGPLIDALVTTHKYKIVTRNPGSMSTTFGTGPNGAAGPSGLSMGGGPKIVEQRHTNQSVLDALATITGQNFSFDQQAWRYWYASQKKRSTLDARRD